MTTSSEHRTNRLVDDFAAVCIGLDKFLGEGTVVDRATEFSHVRPTLVSRHQDALEYLNSLRLDISSIDDSVLRRDIIASIDAVYSFAFYKMCVSKDLYKTTLDKIYGPKISKVPEDVIDRQKRQIVDRLNASGIKCNSLNGINEWRRSNLIGAADYVYGLEKFIQIGKTLTSKKIFPHFLNSEEISTIMRSLNINVSVVNTDADWIAYCFYNGNYQASIELNSRREYYRDSAAIFALHETMPGHVAEAAIREFLFKNGKLHRFYTMQLLNTPRNLISEGIADYSVEFFKDDLEPSAYMGFLEEKYFTDWRHNIGLDLANGKIKLEQAVEHLSKETLCSTERAEKALKFAINWDCYFPTYASGFYEVKKHLIEHGSDGWRHLYLENKIW